MTSDGNNRSDNSRSMPTLGGERSEMRKKRSEGPALPSPQVLDLAYKIKAKEAQEKQKRIEAVHLRRAEMRNKGLIQFGLSALFLVFCTAAYFLYSEMRTQTKIETVENNLIEKINLAYKGDQVAHEEILKRIPVLTKSRLVNNLRRAESISESLASLDDADTSEKLNEEVAGIEPVEVFASDKTGAQLIGELSHDADVIDIKYGEEWSSIMLSTGFRLWIHQDFVEETSNNMLKVRGQRVNLRSQPELAPSFIVGRVNDGDSLQMLGKRNSWYQVNSPADLKGWVRTKSFKNLLR